MGGFLVFSAMMAASPARADKIAHPIAVFTGLDKITGRTIAFEAATGETVQFGTLQITERACYTRPATEAPQTVTFVQVDEIDAEKQYKRIFSGWMFASSPGLHAIEHPIYDIWLTECRGGGEPGEGTPASGNPAEVPPVAPDSPELSKQEPPPAPAQPEKPVPRKGHSRKNRAPPPEAPMKDPPPQEQQDAAPPMGGPIEVGPPPGFIPAPDGNQRHPSAPQD